MTRPLARNIRIQVTQNNGANGMDRGRHGFLIHGLANGGMLEMLEATFKG
jgi:hypothetical protein